MKQRLQQCCSPYKSAWNCANTVYRTEGLGAFYRSYTTMLTMNIPFQVKLNFTKIRFSVLFIAFIVSNI